MSIESSDELRDDPVSNSRRRAERKRSYSTSIQIPNDGRSVVRARDDDREATR